MAVLTISMGVTCLSAEAQSVPLAEAEAAAAKYWNSGFAKCGDSYYERYEAADSLVDALAGRDKHTTVMQYLQPSFLILRNKKVEDADRLNGYQWIGHLVMIAKARRGVRLQEEGNWEDWGNVEWTNGAKGREYGSGTVWDNRDHGVEIISGRTQGITSALVQTDGQVWLDQVVSDAEMWKKNGRWYYGTGECPFAEKSCEQIDLEREAARKPSCNAAPISPLAPTGGSGTAGQSAGKVPALPAPAPRPEPRQDAPAFECTPSSNTPCAHRRD